MKDKEMRKIFERWIKETYRWGCYAPKERKFRWRGGIPYILHYSPTMGVWSIECFVGELDAFKAGYLVSQPNRKSRGGED